MGGGSFRIDGDFRESILLWDGNGQSSGPGGVRGIILARAAPAWESRRGIGEDCVGLVMGGSHCIGRWGIVVLCITGGSGFDDSMGPMWAMVSTALGRLGALVNGAAGFWWRADGAVSVEADGRVKDLSCVWGLIFLGG